MLSTVAHELKRRGAGGSSSSPNIPELYAANTDFDGVATPDPAEPSHSSVSPTITRWTSPT